MAAVHTINWVNPTTNTDGTAYDAANENAGYVIALDNDPSGVVAVPVAFASSFDLSTLSQFSDLKAGSHTARIAVVNKGGVQSEFSAAATFPVVGTPNAPTNVVVA